MWVESPVIAVNVIRALGCTHVYSANFRFRSRKTFTRNLACEGQARLPARNDISPAASSRTIISCTFLRSVVGSCRPPPFRHTYSSSIYTATRSRTDEMPKLLGTAVAPLSIVILLLAASRMNACVEIDANTVSGTTYIDPEADAELLTEYTFSCPTG